jgi:hypothetical protein
MNSLSWIIYFAGIVNGVTAILIIAAMLLLGFAGFASAIIGMEDRDPPAWMRKYIVVGVVCAVISVALPSQKTIMLIASSEIGQDLAEDTSSKAYRAVNKWLDDYLEEQPGDRN